LQLKTFFITSFFSGIIILSSCYLPIGPHVSLDKKESDYTHFVSKDNKYYKENNKAAAALDEGRTDEALKSLVTLVQSEDAPIEAYLNLSGIYGQAGDWNRVKRLWQVLASDKSVTDDEYKRAILSLDEKKRNIEVIISLEESLRYGRMVEFSAMELGHRAEHYGNNKEAFAAYQALLLWKPGHQAALASIADLFYRNNQKSAAFFFYSLHPGVLSDPSRCYRRIDSLVKDRQLSSMINSAKKYIYLQAFVSLSEETSSAGEKEKILYNLLLKHVKEFEAKSLMAEFKSGRLPAESRNQKYSELILKEAGRCPVKNRSVELTELMGNIILTEDYTADLNHLRGDLDEESWSELLEKWYGTDTVPADLKKNIIDEFRLMY
jgi:hypothetical protein